MLLYNLYDIIKNKNYGSVNMSIEKVREYFKAVGIEGRIKEFSESSAIELTIAELERYSGYLAWVDVCKPREV